MGFNLDFLNKLFPSLKLLEARSPSASSISVASIGYPDLILSKDKVSLIKDQSLLSNISDDPKILKWHGLTNQPYTCLNVEAYLTKRGYTFTYLDIYEGTGPNSTFKCIDLNHKLEGSMYCQYDLIMDSGTSEHCFNIGQVFENYFHMLKPGGILLQYIPFLSPNHGFWSANPTIVFDIASCNPIKVFSCELSEYSSYKDYFDGIYTPVKFSSSSRFSLNCKSSSNIILMFFAYKKLKKSIFQFPIQTKYRVK